MTPQTFSISFSSDEEDFISRACPECGTRFKAKVTDGEINISSCPFCQHEGDRWETPEQLEYGKAYAARQVLQPEFDKLARAFKSLGRAGGMVKVTGRMPDLNVPPKPVERTEDMPKRTTSACCNATVRHDEDVHPRFCIACGNAAA